MANKRAVQRVALLSLHSSPIAPLGRSDAGGMNLYVRRLADGLCERGVSVDIFTRRDDSEIPDVTELESGARVISLAAGPLRRLPKATLPLHIPAMVSAFRSFLVEHGVEYDILHSHYWLSGIATMRFRVQNDDSTPFVHMFHTLIKLKEYYLGEPDRADSALRFDGERCLIGRANTIVGATSDELSDIQQHYGRSPAHYEVIPPGVDLDLFIPSDMAEARRSLGLRAPLVILFVGRQDRLKGLDLLLRSVAALPDRLRTQLQLVLVGGQDWRREETVRTDRLIKRLGLQTIVDIRGRVRQAELPTYYTAADICAVPSAYESFGMVAMESMACQTPVVAFRVGGLATTITDGKTGFLVERRDTAHYARTLMEALESPARNAMGRRARLEAQHYSWDRTVDHTMALYDELARDRLASRLRYAAH